MPQEMSDLGNLRDCVILNGTQASEIKLAL